MTAVPPTNFRWIVPRRLAGSGRLAQVENVRYLGEQGIHAVVSTVQLGEDVTAAIDEIGMEHLYLPVEDFGVPTDEQIERFLAFMDEHVARSQPVLIHCAYGVGRTGTLGALWLVHAGASAQDALDRVGVESSTQTKLVRRWEDRELERG